MGLVEATEDAERVHLGGKTYNWCGGQLQDAHGHHVPLRAKSLKMFEMLMAERGTVLSKEKLAERVWPDTVATDESIARCIADIRKALNDDTHEIVETFPKQGYRLNVGPAPDERERSTFPWNYGALVVTALAVLAIVSFAQFKGSFDAPNTKGDPAEIGTPMLNRNAVVILPFTTHAEDDQFLAAGLSDDLEIHLAEVTGIRVVSQAHSAALAGTFDSPVTLAESLDAGYIVHGNVRRKGTQYALSLQLIDGSDGTTLWADRYEGPREGLVAFRNTLPAALVGAMSVDLNARDRQRLGVADTTDPVAFEEVMQARRALSLFTYESSLAAERHLRKALEHDPNYARAYAELASAYAIRMENDWIVLSSADTEKAFFFAEKALEIDPDLWFANYVLGRLHSVAAEGDIATAMKHLRKAMSLQPANDDARVYFAIVNMMSGRLDEAFAVMESVMATHPDPPFWYHLGMGNVLFHLRRYDDAGESIAQCLKQMPNSPYCLRSQIAILAQLGRVDDAAWAIEEYEILGHETTLDSIMKSAIERDEGVRAHLRESYKLAGIE